ASAPRRTGPPPRPARRGAARAARAIARPTARAARSPSPPGSARRPRPQGLAGCAPAGPRSRARGTRSRAARMCRGSRAFLPVAEERLARLAPRCAAELVLRDARLHLGFQEAEDPIRARLVRDAEAQARASLQERHPDRLRLGLAREPGNLGGEPLD